MMRNHIPEEWILDYINQELSEQEVNKVKEHLEWCPECQELYTFWVQTLNDEVEVPSEEKKAVWNKLSTSVQQHKRKSFRTWYKGLLVAAACAIFFITGLFTGGNVFSPKEQASEQEVNDEQFIIDTETEMYDLIQTSNGDNRGYAWYNPVQKEMILYLDDEDLQNYYEANIQTRDSTINKTPIYLNNGNKHVYIKDQKLKEFYRLILINQLNQKPVKSYEFKTINTSSP
ncbi:anti-sigma factor family protein [Salinibacillus xinjiangensis]|nr:zf-HC2 domain-containing protein [Salinibacillus xinjiangensis]